jgi:hypothetical protein
MQRKFLGTDGRTEVKQYTSPPVERGYNKQHDINVLLENDLDLLFFSLVSQE